MNREEEGEARRGVSEKKPLRWDDGTDEESGGGEDGWRGETVLLYCVAAPEHHPVPL